MTSADLRRKVFFHGSAILFYLAVSLIVLRPLPSRFFDALQGYGDIWMVTWNFWWVKTALAKGLPIFHTDYLYYPTGVSLYFHALSPLNALLSVPFQAFLNACAVNNLFFISKYVLSGYAGFLLVHHFTRSIPASIAAGCIYTFSPYHFAHYQIEHLSLEWPAFLLLALFRFREQPTIWRAIVAALLFLATFFSNVYYGLYMAVLLAAFIPWSLPGRIKGWIAFGVVCAAGLLPYLAPMFSAGSGFKSPYWIHIYQSLDLLAFITPSPNNPLIPRSPLYDAFTSGEPIGYIGIGVIALAITGFRKSAIAERRFLAIAALLFLVLSLGPRLHIAGSILPVPLPQAILQSLPVIGSARVPARYISIAMLAISVLAGFGLAHLWKSNRRGIFALACVLVTFEYWNAPLLVTDPPYPEYTRIIASDPGDVVVMDLPHRISSDPAEWWRSADPDTRGWYQTLHGKKSMTGPASHTALRREHFLYLLNSPALAPLTSDTTVVPDTTQARSEIANLNIRYFVLHKTYGDVTREVKYLEFLGAEKIHDEAWVALYRFEITP